MRTGPRDHSIERQGMRGYLVAAGATAAAVLVRLALMPWLAADAPTLMLVPAVLVAAWYGGLRPGLLATVLSLLAVAVFFLEPIGSLSIARPSDQLRMVLLAAIGVAVSWLLETMHRQRRRTAEGRELLRITLASIGDAVLSTDTQGRVIHLNPVAESLTGWRSGEAEGVPLTQVFQIVNESTRQPVDNPALKALRDGMLVGLAYHTVLIAKDGTERPIDDSAAPIRDAAGRVMGAVLVFRDVTERRRAEIAQAEQTRLTGLRAEVGTLLATSRSTRAALQGCCEAIVGNLHAAFARIWTLNEPENILELQASAGTYTHLDGPHSRVPVGQFKIGRIAESRRPHLTNDVLHDPNVSDQEWARREGMVAFAGYPLLVEGRAVGVMALFARTPLTERILADLAPLAEGIAQYIDRKRAEEALRQSQARNAAVVSSAIDGIITIDHEGKILEFNPAAERTFGYRSEEVLGREMAEFIIPLPLRDSHRRGIARYLATGEGPLLDRHLELTAVRSDGTEFPVELAITRINNDGPPLFTGYIRDITDRQRDRAALAESAERLRFMAESMPQKIFTARPNGDVDYFNPQWMEFSGLSFEQIREWGWTQFVHPDDVEENVRVWRRSVDTGEPFQFEHRFRRADGEYRWHISRAMPMRDEQGRIIQWIGSNTDIHEIKSLQDELRRVAAELSEADRRKTEFLATLGHELRNPLAPIRMGLELMKRVKHDPARIEDIRSTMERQAQQMVRLIDDLLNVSRITQGKLELRTCRTALADVVQSAVEATRPYLDEAGHELTVTLPPQPILLDADPNRLAQVFSNLLNNSARYTPAGGRIQLTAERQGSDVVVAVRDNGIGIHADMQHGIFDMFTQIDRPLEQGDKGLGIGLTLVKRLVEMHGGTIEVHSEGIGQGSEFCVRLPALVDSHVIEQQPLQATPASQPARLRILVVDDNKAAADLLGMVVEMLGNEVRTTYDGSQGIQAAAEFRPNVVLMDLGMPRMNGYEAARHIREQPWGGDMVLVALTGWGQDEDKLRAKQAGFDHHLVKPAEPAALQKLLAEVARVTPAPAPP